MLQRFFAGRSFKDGIDASVSANLDRMCERLRSLLTARDRNGKLRRRLVRIRYGDQS